MDKWEKIKGLKNLETLGEAPTEASQNLQAPELAPGDQRITGRTKPLSLKSKPTFHWELKKLAAEKGCLMIEILEMALEVYKKNSVYQNETKSSSLTKDEKQRKKENQHQQPKDKRQESEISPQIKQKETKKPLNQFWKVNFNCDKCYRKFEKSRVYSLAPDLDQLNQYPTYCADCGEGKPKFCSFWTETSQELCPHFVFDKKKQLCRSHNKQVWKKFHEFTKEMSVSSTASWYEVWNQSGDWKYFWNLAKEKKENNEN